MTDLGRYEENGLLGRDRSVLAVLKHRFIGSLGVSIGIRLTSQRGIFLSCRGSVIPVVIFPVSRVLAVTITPAPPTVRVVHKRRA